MIKQLLEKRRGHGVSDEDEEAYLLGVKDALSALLSDEVYYGPLSAKPGLSNAVEDAVRFVRGDYFPDLAPFEATA